MQPATAGMLPPSDSSDEDDDEEGEEEEKEEAPKAKPLRAAVPDAPK